MKKMHKNLKRHFQLLELMVAIFILFVCIAPAMKIFTTMYVSQQGIIRENQIERIVDSVHAKVVEMLYTGAIPIHAELQKHAVPIRDEYLEKELKKYVYSCDVTLTIIDKLPKREDKIKKYLGEIKIKLTDQKEKAAKPMEFDYLVYIDAKKK